MTLIDCPGCGEQVSDTDGACPHCDRSLDGVAPRPARGGVPAWAWWLIGIFVVMPGLVLTLVVVASVVLPGVVSKMDSAAISQARVEMRIIENLLDLYAINNGGVYPESLDVLAEPDEDGYAYADSPEDLIDPWGVPYGYAPPEPPERKPRIVCYGADGEPGGEGDAADFDNLAGF